MSVMCISSSLTWSRHNSLLWQLMPIFLPFSFPSNTAHNPIHQTDLFLTNKYFTLFLLFRPPFFPCFSPISSSNLSLLLFHIYSFWSFNKHSKLLLERLLLLKSLFPLCVVWAVYIIWFELLCQTFEGVFLILSEWINKKCWRLRYD